ncbi:hypothetical protein Tco_0625133 [Tanacetum coccineum]|uniref:Uncharacterized protein n=1 Tax=Tanacetum coccineum TaxID=301880 RepID=A0ABQ4WFY5_9ASTR
MVNSIHNNKSPTSSNAPSDKSPPFKKSNNLHHENNDDDYMQERSRKKERMLKPDMNTSSAHFCKPIKQNCNGILKKKHKRGGLSFPDFLLVRHGDTQGNDLIWDSRYVEWCSENSSPDTPTTIFTSVQEDCKPRPRDYPFKKWLLTKVRHIDVSKPVKKDLLKSWLIDCFREELVKDPRSRSFDDYKLVFDLKIDQLADEYELGFGKKGNMVDDIWENCKKV